MSGKLQLPRTATGFFKEDDPLIETLIPANDCIHPGIETVTFAGKAVYRNPFPTNVLTEDETAIARLLLGMKNYLETGTTITSRKQPWAD